MEDSYFAGLIDGEGWVSSKSSRGNGRRRIPIICVGMTHRKTIYSLKKHFGCGSIYKHKKYNEKHKQAWYWTVKAMNAKRVAERLIPYSITKAEELKKVSEYESAPTGRPRLISIRGKTQRLGLWCEEFGIPLRTAQYRLSKGTKPEDLFKKK